MAETDVLYEFSREPGFSSSVLGPEHSHMLHKHIYKIIMGRNPKMKNDVMRM